MINKKEINKIDRMIGYPKPNLPVPATLVVCCLIDSLARNYSGDGCERFTRYIKSKMIATFNQLQQNDNLKKERIKALNCGFRSHTNEHCSDSAEILYRHVRCGLVHNYFEKEGYILINRPNVKQEGIIIDQSVKFRDYALVINAPAFIKDFLSSL